MHKILESVDKTLNNVGINKSQKSYVAVSGGSDLSRTACILYHYLATDVIYYTFNRLLRDVDSQ